jgi:hypothetical protein
MGGSVTFDRDNYWRLADNVSAFHDLLPYTSAGPRPYLATANLSVHRSVIDRAGLLEPGLTRAHDLEWTVRFRKLGFTLYFEPNAVVTHVPPRTTPKLLWQHWVNDAHDTLSVRLRYASELHTPGMARHRWAFLAAAPAIAGWATLRTYQHFYTRRLYWQVILPVYFTKLAWCWGALSRFPKQKRERRD